MKVEVSDHRCMCKKCSCSEECWEIKDEVIVNNCGKCICYDECCEQDDE